MDQGTKAEEKKDQRSCRAAKRRGELPKKREAVGRQKMKMKESQRREISGTEAKRQQNRDQRDQPNKEERVQGDHKGSGKRKNRGIEGGGSRVESQIKGANRPRSEAVETLPEANQRGESVVSGETDSKSQSKGRKSISQGVTGS